MSAQQLSSRFATGDRDLVSLTFGNLPRQALPPEITVQSGSVRPVIHFGQPMLRVAERTALLVHLPEVLPANFTLEFDFVPKTCCQPEDISFEGTRTINQGPSSANVLWHRNNLMVIGGSSTNYHSLVPEPLASSTPGRLTHIVFTVQGDHMTLHTNGQQLFGLTNRKFARDSILRVFLGGQVEPGREVYLARLRVVANAAGPVVGTSPTAGQQTAILGTPPSPATGRTSGTTIGSAPTQRGATVMPSGPAPVGLTVTGTPITASLHWGAAAGAVNYRVYRGLAGTTTRTELTNGPITATAYPNDILPDPTKTYTYQVVAYHADGTSGAATIDFLAPPPVDPSGFVATSAQAGLVQLSWQPVTGVTQYHVTGPGIPANTVTFTSSFQVTAVPPGLHAYRVASVYPPRGTLSAATSWPSATVKVRPNPSVLELTMRNGSGSLAEYNLHVCHAGQWIGAQLVLPNSWCAIDPATSTARVDALPWLTLFGIQEDATRDPLILTYSSPYGSRTQRPEGFTPASTWTTFEWPWAVANARVPEPIFVDLADLNRGRRVGCVARGTGATAATLCWASTTPHDVFEQIRNGNDPQSTAVRDGLYARANARRWENLSVIIQTAGGTSFLTYGVVPSTGCPASIEGWGSCQELQGSPQVQLDSRGQRMVPHACLSCHGGTFDPRTGRVTGATLLALDPKGFENRGWDSKQEEAARVVNAIVFNSPAVAPGVREYIDGMYGGRQFIPGTSANTSFVPPGWASQPGLYRNVYRPYCASCHNTMSGSLGFRTWNDMVQEKVRIKHSVCTGTMPHAEVPFGRFWSEGGPVLWPGVLLASLGYPSC